MRRLLIPFALLLFGCSSSGDAPEGDPSTTVSAAAVRTFHIRYEAELPGLEAGQKVRLWIPIPTDDPHQTISGLAVKAPWEHRITEEPKFGNRMLYLEGTAEAGTAAISVEYDVARSEATTDPASLLPEGEDPKADYARFLTETKLVVVDDRIRKEAANLMEDRTDTYSKARAFYDRVQDSMVYDKSGEGWGTGDSLFACDVGKGNCTDYHAYFMALCLAADIPSRFQIGLYGSYERKPGVEYQTGGYHCWAEFRVPGKAWVPVDISEGDKDPSRADYFFGSHSDNRVTLSTGRDLVLEPKQAGAPLNYFLNPYAEVDGKPFAAATKTAYWTDAN